MEEQSKEAAIAAVNEINNRVEQELGSIISKFGLEEKTALTIRNGLSDFLFEAEEWSKKAEGLVITDPSQLAEMKMARDARLYVKGVRIAADKRRKELKEDSKRYGDTVQAVYNLIESRLKPIEEHLKEQEDFIEIQREKVIEESRLRRTAELQPYSEFIPPGVDLGLMTEDNYRTLLDNSKFLLQRRIDEAKKVEEEKLERERLDKLEHERKLIVAPYSQFITEDMSLRDMSAEDFSTVVEGLKAAKGDYDGKQEELRKENERLRAEADEANRIAAEAAAKQKEINDKMIREAKDREAKIKADADKKLKDEREERERLEKQIAIKQAEERKQKEAADKAAKKAAAAPDKTKMKVVRDQINAIVMPELKTDEFLAIAKNTSELLKKVVKYMDEIMEEI